MNKKIAVLVAALVCALFFAIPLGSVLKSVKLKKHGIKTEAVVQVQ
jgi:cation transport ATPase